MARQKAFVETMVCGCTLVITFALGLVITIEPSEDALILGEVDKLVSSPVEPYHCLSSIDSLPHHPTEKRNNKT